MKDLPPNAEAEFWLLGCVFRDPRIMAQFAHALEPNDFLLEKHRLIWQAFQTLQKDGRSIDIVTVISEIEKSGKFKSAFNGDNSYIYEACENSVPSAASADYYVELVAKASALRKLIAALQTTLKEAKESDAEAEVLASAAMDRITAINCRPDMSTITHIADIVEQALDDIKDRMIRGVPAGAGTGFNELDRLVGGMRPGELVILGGRPGMGKSSFALCIAMHAAKTMPVKFYSMEMDKRTMAPKVPCYINDINLQRTINANLTNDEMDSHYAVIEVLRGYNLHMEFKTSMKAQEICADAHAFTARYGKGLIVIDHLHFIKPDEKNYESKNIDIGKITHAMKDLAKRLEVPVLLLSQLNRALDRATTKKPRLSDLRDSGNIEQDADMVWFVHREGYYDTGKNPADTEIIVAKNRSGPTGTANQLFDPYTTKFSNG